MAYPEIDILRLSGLWPELAQIDAATAERLETEAKYAVYLERQSAEAAFILKEDERVIPGDLDFSSIPGLSNELKQKLTSRRPTSIGEAQRIEGMTPAALAILLSRASNAKSRSEAA